MKMTRERLTAIENKLGWGGGDTWPVPKHILLWACAAEKLIAEKEAWEEQAKQLYQASTGDTSLDEWNKVYAAYEALKASNDPSSATRRTGRTDCNRDAPAGFAAAHG
jgi:hypothetical protein